MKHLVAVLLFCLPSLFAAGPISFGVKGGTPLTDFVDTATSSQRQFFSETQRYTVGPMVEVHLPFRLSVELDALYKEFSYGQFAFAGINPFETSGSQWEFPLVAKYRFSGGLLRPYIGAGASYRRITDLSQVTNFLTGNGTSTTSNPSEIRNRNNVGFVAEAGVELKVLFLRISPEFRFTRWGVNNFREGVTGLLETNRNQGEFLVGFTF